MGEPEGGRGASFIPFTLPHYWGLGGLRNRFYTVSKQSLRSATKWNSALAPLRLPLGGMSRVTLQMGGADLPRGTLIAVIALLGTRVEPALDAEFKRPAQRGKKSYF